MKYRRSDIVDIADPIKWDFSTHPGPAQFRGLRIASLICTLHLGPNRLNPTSQKSRCLRHRVGGPLHGIAWVAWAVWVGVARMVVFVVVVAHLTQTHRNGNPTRVCSVKRHWYQCTSRRLAIARGSFAPGSSSSTRGSAAGSSKRGSAGGGVTQDHKNTRDTETSHHDEASRHHESLDS